MDDADIHSPFPIKAAFARSHMLRSVSAEVQYPSSSSQFPRRDVQVGSSVIPDLSDNSSSSDDNSNANDDDKGNDSNGDDTSNGDNISNGDNTSNGRNTSNDDDNRNRNNDIDENRISSTDSRTAQTRNSSSQKARPAASGYDFGAQAGCEVDAEATEQEGYVCGSGESLPRVLQGIVQGTKRETILTETGDKDSMQQSQKDKRSQFDKKARPGRGPKTAPWVNFVHKELKEEFKRLRKTGLKFSPQLLKIVGRKVLKNSRGEFNAESRDENGKLLIDKIQKLRIHTFMSKSNIVIRPQTGKLLCSPDKEKMIEQSIAVHMGELKRGFDSGKLNKDLIKNVDKTHFVINMDNKRTLAMQGNQKVKYADVVGSESMTMMVCVTGGRRARTVLKRP
ncbi:hypothetical protein DFS34DRAFT_646116 [Phlyctochytrium arcticum]|nr:hypothetical protein DFS34DRAFT_646116 [Phlyctochytrium arcticum]